MVSWYLLPCNFRPSDIQPKYRDPSSALEVIQKENEELIENPQGKLFDRMSLAEIIKPIIDLGIPTY